MTHHAPDTNTVSAALELLIQHGFDGLARPLEMLLNEAMRFERAAYLGAGPWERTDSRRGYANGFKTKTMTTRLSELTLEIPKTRDHRDDAEPFTRRLSSVASDPSRPSSSRSPRCTSRASRPAR